MAVQMSNPVLNQNRFQPDEAELRPGWGSPQAGMVAGAAGAPPTAPPTSPVEDGRRMTVGGTVTATLVLWLLLLTTGAWGFSQVTVIPEVVDPGSGLVLQPAGAEMPSWFFLPALVGLGLAFVMIFKPKLARFLAPLYALAYGVTLGIISGYYEAIFDGIVLQAVGATLAVFGVMLFLYAARIIKVTRRFVMVVVGATAGIFLMYMVAWVASIFGADIYFWNEPNALGIGISVAIAIVAALNLAIDFAFIESASKAGMPKYMEWYGAFGITVTIVWLYLEMLRLLALLRQ